MCVITAMVDVLPVNERGEIKLVYSSVFRLGAW